MRGSRWAAAITIGVFGIGAVALSQVGGPVVGAAADTCYSHEAADVVDHGHVVNGNSVVLNPYQDNWIYGTAGRYGMLTVTSESGQIAFHQDPVAGVAYFAPDNGPVLFWEVCKTDRPVEVTPPPPTTNPAPPTTNPAPPTTVAPPPAEPATTVAPPPVEPTTTAPVVLDQDVIAPDATGNTLPRTA